MTDEKEVLEVEAVPIETAPAEPLQGLERIIADVAARADATAAEYQATPIENEEQYAQAKRERAGLNKAKEGIRAEYKEVADPVRTALRDADARIKLALARLDEARGEYGEAISNYEWRWRANRKEAVRAAFEEFAPDLAPLVDFDVFWGRFAQDKGAQWDARSMAEAKAIEAMEQAVASIAKDEEFITSSPYEDEDKEALKADYFRTLDLSGALRRVQEAKEQRERVARLEKERKERERAAQEAREEAARAAEEARRLRLEQEEASRQEAAPIIDTKSTVTREELEELRVQTGSQPTRPPKPLDPYDRHVREVVGAQTYLVALFSCTQKQVRTLGATLGKLGIHGKPCGTGVLLSEGQCDDLLMHAKTRARGYAQR